MVYHKIILVLAIVDYAVLVIALLESISQIYTVLPHIKAIIKDWSHLVVGVKHTVTKLNIQCSALHVNSCQQNSPMASQIINSV